METVAGDCGAFGESVVFLSHFKALEDPRQAGKVLYPLDEILMLCLLAVLAGAETFVDSARFGEKKIDLLRRFRPFLHGTPAHDHLVDIFAALDAAAFQRCFVAWVATVTARRPRPSRSMARRCAAPIRRRVPKEPIHMVSALAARQPQ
jgi:hypothetical protein